MAIELEGLEFKVEGLSGNGTTGLKDLASALSGLKSALPTKSRLKALQDLNNLNLTPAIADIRSLTDALKDLKAVSNIKVKIGTGGIKGAGNGASGGSSNKAQDSAASQVADEWKNIDFSGSLPLQDTENFFGTIRLGFSTALHLSGEFAKSLANIGVAGLKGMASIPKFFAGKLAGAIQTATGKLGGLLAGLKRIAMYRALRTAIRLITEGFATGLKNVYEYSKMVGTSFASDMDSIATNALYLKNSLGAMAAPLVSALAPAVDFLIGKFVALLNVINMFIARLSGSSVATVAKKTFKSWGDEAKKSSGKVKKAVKEIRRTLLGFDEINRLDAPNKSNSSPGGSPGGGGPDVGSMFEQVPIEKNISEFADKVIELFKQGKWEELGTFLGQKFNQLLDDIPWGKMGETVGKGIDAVIKVAYGFLKEAKFLKLGAKFAKFLNSALSKIDTEKLGRLLVRAFTVLPGILIGVLTNVKWGRVSRKASDFIIGIFDEAAEWIKSIKWGEVTQKLYDGTKNAVKNVKWKGISKAVGKFLGDAFGAIASILATIGYNLFMDIGKGLKKAVKGAKSWWKNNVAKPFQKGLAKGGVWTGMKEVAKAIWESLKKGFKNLTKNIWKNFGKPFADAFKDTFANSGEAGQKILEIGKSIPETIAAGVKAIISKPIEWLKGLIFGDSEVDENTNLASVGIGVGLKKEGWTSVGGWFDDLGASVTQKVADIKVGLKETWTSIQSWFNDKKETAAEFVDGVKVKLGKAWNSVGEWFSGLRESAGEFVDGVKVKLGKAWSTVQNWFNGENQSPLDWEGVKVKLIKGWTTVKTWLSDLGQNVLDWEGVRVTLVKGWGYVKDWFSGLGQAAYDWNGVRVKLAKGWSYVSTWFEGLGQGTFSWSGVVVKLAKGWSYVSTWFSGLKQNQLSWSGIVVKLAKGWDTLKTWFQGLKQNQLGWSGIVVKLAQGWSSLKDWLLNVVKPKGLTWKAITVQLVKGWTSIKEWFNSVTTGSKNKRPTVDVNVSPHSSTTHYGAKGAVIKNGHFHNSIPQYASGGLPSHGTMFVAGEAGAEIVGDINGRTEVLNASQLASTIHSAVLSAMQQANASGTSPVFNITVRTENDEVLARAVTRGQRSLDARLNPTSVYA